MPQEPWQNGDTFEADVNGGKAIMYARFSRGNSLHAALYSPSYLLLVLSLADRKPSFGKPCGFSVRNKGRLPLTRVM